MITRKQFFKMLGFGAVSAVIAPSLTAKQIEDGYYAAHPWFEQTYPKPPLNTFLPASEVMALRSHLEEAAKDPDYTIVTNYGISEVFKVMHYYNIKLAPGAVVIEAEDCPATTIVEIREKINSDPDFRSNLPDLATSGTDDEENPYPSLKELITNWFIF